MEKCHFRTPIFYGFDFEVDTIDDEITIVFVIKMENIDLSSYENELNEEAKAEILRINLCLKEHGINHNDMALRNIGIPTTGEILILDWGEAFLNKYGTNSLSNLSRAQLD